MRQFEGEVDTIIFPDLLFLQDGVLQELSKSVDFHGVIKKTGCVF